MKRISLLLGIALLAASTAGCGCCSWLHPRPAAVTVAQPVCPPAPACDPCATAPVGYGPATIAPYTPPPAW